MPLPVRAQAVTPFQQYLQDTFLADTQMMSVLATDGVYVGGYPRLPGAPPTPKPNLLISTATEIATFPAFFQIGSQNAQQIDIFTDEVASTMKLGAIFSRIVALLDNQRPVIAGFLAYRHTRVEWIANFPDADGHSMHGICIVNPSLRTVA